MLVVVEHHVGATVEQVQSFISGTTNTIYCQWPDDDCVKIYPVASGCRWFVNAHAGITQEQFEQGLLDQYVFVDSTKGVVYYPPEDLG